MNSKQRNVLQDYARKQVNVADQLKGYTCPHCGQLGQHFQDRCPVKPFIGVPEVKRMAMQEAAILEAAGPTGPLGGEVQTDKSLPPGFISGAELRCMLRSRLDVPSFLRCTACCQLAVDAVWCQTCDTIACSGCLAPGEEPWLCPHCNGISEDNFHVVTAIRRMADGWMKAMAMEVDTKLGLMIHPEL